MWSKIKWLLGFYRDYPHVVAILLIMTPIQAVFQVAGPRMIGFTIDYLKTSEVSDFWMARLFADWGETFDFSPTTAFALGFIAIGIVSFSLYAYFQSWRAWMNLRLEWIVRQYAFDAITSKGPDFFNKFRTGDLVTRMTNDVEEKLSWFACSGIFRLYEAVIAIVFIVIMMASIDPILTLFTAGPLPLLIVIFFKSQSLLDKRYDRLQKSISRVNDAMEACFSGIRVVKAYVREEAQQSKFETASSDRRNAEIESVKSTTIIDSLYNYIWQFGVVVVLFAGGYRVLYSGLSMGEMATFIYYVVWLVFPMFDVGQFLVKSRQSAVSIGRILELEAMPAMVTDENAMPVGAQRPIAAGAQAGIRYEEVSFSFPASPRAIVDNVSLEIAAGQTVALVGRVGSGKSWVANLIPRLVDPVSGRITLDGRDLRSYGLAELRAAIGYVPQEPVLFSDTIRNNILFGRVGISDETLDWALAVSQFKTEISAFPDGVETAIGTRGMSISGGQKQRLALARALVGKPRILILDDCTSALDSRTETALWDRLHEVLPDVTAVLITHRPDTLQRVDNIFVLADGKIVERGRHSELLTLGGEYARIYKRYELEEAVGGQPAVSASSGEPGIYSANGAAVAK
jgi:ATP-binding cassette, subfamily B, multidrug efflux pump